MSSPLPSFFVSLPLSFGSQHLSEHFHMASVCYLEDVMVEQVVEKTFDM